jgi:hypothetical protein
MGFFDRFRAATDFPGDAYAALPSTAHMRVVGESHYQEVLSQIVSRCVPAPDGHPCFPVVLVPEPDNPYDSNAIAVISALGCVGYLPRDDARRYGPTLQAVMERGYSGGSCTALLNGGAVDRPNYGVVLVLSYPEDCERHFGL